MDSADGLPRMVVETLVFLAATALIVPAFRRARLSAVMGFLVIGVLIGPHGLPRYADAVPAFSILAFPENEEVHLLGELGVVFLLFVIGLEVSSARLWAMRRMVFGLGASQVAVCAAAIGLAVFLMGSHYGAAIVIGLALALSSTAVVLQLLEERRQLSGVVGRTSFAILLLQDIAVVPVLFVVGALGANAVSLSPAGVGAASLAAGAAVAGIVIFGRFVLRPMLRWASAAGGREVFVAAVLLTVVGASSAAAMAGLSMALGAFLAGVLLAETEFRHEIEVDLEPFKGLLLGLFFVTVGMQIDITLLVSEPLVILAGLLALLAAKAAIIAPLVRLFGLDWRRAVEVAFLLAPAGEFAFVVLADARAGGVIDSGLSDYLLLLVALSLFLAPFMATLGGWLAGRNLTYRDLDPPPELATREGHVVIAGCGRVGQSLARLLDAQGFAHIALDADAERVGDLRRKGFRVHFGDASRKDMLAAVGVGRAAAIAVTMDSPDAVERVVAEVSRAWPGVPIFARARDIDQARRLRRAGAEKVAPETVEATLQLGEALLNQLGVPDEAARRIINDVRDAEGLSMLHDRPAQG